MATRINSSETIKDWLTNVSLCSLILLNILLAALRLAELFDLQATVKL
jgi:hypothetical protein